MSPEKNSDIFLDDITVSGRHAQFRCVNAEFRVIDVGSLNRTYVNREPVDSAVLANGDELQIDKFRLMFLSGPTTDGTESEGSSRRTSSEPSEPAWATGLMRSWSPQINRVGSPDEKCNRLQALTAWPRWSTTDRKLRKNAALAERSDSDE
jgi:pSer/pThr/pTyr-binding forkhead associated (FHA) protein